ncbi:MAG: N-acetylmuramoyl-L-alanine amidase family 2, partial [Frankiales bacterium]|nr:N-acetylmuramoyl-L-alanine amidase family 2 [Frankiales bacterium]
GASFPDALAGGPAAAALGGPVLLVQRDRVPQVVLDELRRLRPERVLVLGGEAAVSATATAQLAREPFVVQRVAGAGRYETAAQVSSTVFASPAPLAYVATGADYPDALAGAAAAGAVRAPLLLVARDSVPSATAQELARLDPERIVVLGGAGAVSDSVTRALASHAPSVSRLAGVDRYATAAAVARSLGTPRGYFLATGRGFADALTGGPAAARAGAPVLLVPTSCIPAVVHVEMERHEYPPVTVLGGTGAVSALAADLRPCVRVPDGELADGVRLSTIDDPRGPWSGKVVSVAPRAQWRLDPVLAQDALPGLETTSSMARRTDALVAVNGDFALSGGRPVHAFARDGRLLQTEQTLGRNFAVSATPTAHIGYPSQDVRLTVHDNGKTAPLSRVNSGASGPGALALTTPEGGRVAPVPGDSCAARLLRQGAPALDDAGRAVQAYTVDEVSCGTAPVAPGDDVLTAPQQGTWAPLLRELVPGQSVDVSWSLGWPGVLDSIGGNPILVDKGRVVEGSVDGTDPFSRRNPRTAVGYRPDGAVLLVTVDGRESDNSAGMTLRELAQLFVDLGAEAALNLDGGGSTTMVIGGEVQNVPSDGLERPVSSALVLLPGSAPSSGGALRRSAPAGRAPEPLPVEQQEAADERIAADPGSTGGLMGSRSSG